MTLDVHALQRALMEIPRVDDDGGGYMRELVAVLVAGGLPLWRVSHALMTMHPEVVWRTVQWESGQDPVVRDQPHARVTDPFYTRSPVMLVRGRSQPVHVPLVAGELPFPICEDLRARGGTDYYAQGLPFTSGQVSYVSFATREPGGFSGEHVRVFAALGPFLARRLELESSYHGTRALLDVYLGRNAARRVLAGAFQRGEGELIDAAIWYSDMRDFTGLSGRSAPAQLVETLDAYFDAIASAIAEHGGEVLKFIGDAVLAIFPVGAAPRTACLAARAAADAAFAALAGFNLRRAADGEGPLAIGVALHRGQVMYGNIGARDRLDFTVISSAVNEAARLEGLCKRLGTPLALSDAFVGAWRGGADEVAEELVDLGLYALKGVAAPLRVHTPRVLLAGEATGA